MVEGGANEEDEGGEAVMEQGDGETGITPSVVGCRLTG